MNTRKSFLTVFFSLTLAMLLSVTSTMIFSDAAYAAINVQQGQECQANYGQDEPNGIWVNLPQSNRMRCDTTISSSPSASPRSIDICQIYLSSSDQRWGTPSQGVILDASGFPVVVDICTEI